jgi:mRNA interferase RelE/StbE
MELLYAKRFSKDLDSIQKESKTRKALLKELETIKEAGSLGEIKGVKKIEGYQEFYRIRIGEYKLGIKIAKNTVELIRFLHRKDIYRRFP